MPPDPLRHQIDAAAAVFVDGVEGTVLREAPRGRRGERMSETGRRVERPAGLEDRVARLLGAEATPRERRQIVPTALRRAIGRRTGRQGRRRDRAIVRRGGAGRLRCSRSGRGSALLLVDGARHDEPVHRLDRPTALHEGRRQMVEQFRMGRRAATDPEIIGRAHETFAEMVSPDAVDHHPRGERILGTRQPPGKFQASAAHRGTVAGRERSSAEHGKRAARNRVAGTIRLAAELDAGIPRRAFAHRVGQLERPVGQQRLELFPRPLAFGFEAGRVDRTPGDAVIGQGGERGGHRRDRRGLHTEVVPCQCAMRRRLRSRTFDPHASQTARRARREPPRRDLGDVPGPADPARYRAGAWIDGELQVVPFLRLQRAQRFGPVADPERRAFRRDQDLDHMAGNGGRGRERADPEDVRLLRSRRSDLGPEVEVHLQLLAGKRCELGRQRLDQPIAPGAGRDARADLAEREEVLERALRLRGDGDRAVVDPRRHEHALAATGRGRLHLEVAVHLVQRPEHGGRR